MRWHNFLITYNRNQKLDNYIILIPISDKRNARDCSLHSEKKMRGRAYLQKQV